MYYCIVTILLINCKTLIFMCIVSNYIQQFTQKLLKYYIITGKSNLYKKNLQLRIDRIFIDWKIYMCGCLLLKLLPIVNSSFWGKFLTVGNTYDWLCFIWIFLVIRLRKTRQQKCNVYVKVAKIIQFIKNIVPGTMCIWEAVEYKSFIQ